MAIRLHRTKDSACDLLKSIKQNYNSPKPSVYTPDKVAARTWDTFALEDEDHWEDTFRRHLNNRYRGLFSVCHQPYKVLGDNVQDIQEILLQNFKRGLPEKFLEGDRKCVRHVILPGQLERDQHGANSKEQDKKDKDVCEYRQRYQKAHTTGMKDIHAVLHETERRIIAVRAGIPYIRHVYDCQTAKEEEALAEQNRIEDKQGMELRKMSSHLLSTSGTTGDLNHMDDGSNKARKFMIGFENQTLVAKPKNLADIVNSPSMNKLRKHMATQLERLETIYWLLCSLYNLHGRTLRKKTPLSPEALKALRKDPFISEERDAQLSNIKRSSAARSYGNSSMTLSSRAEITNSNRESTIDNVLITRRVSSMAKPSPDQGPSSMRFTMRRKTLGRSGGMLTKGSTKDSTVSGPPPPPQVETWEDLVAIGNKNRTPSKANKRQPPWFPASTNTVEKIKIETPIPIKEEDVKHEEFHPEDSVWRTKLHLLELKESVQKDVQNLLAKSDREKMVKFKYKLGAFSDLRPLWEEHRRNLAFISREASRDPDAAVEDVVEWYCKLQGECESAGLGEDQAICDCLSRLQRFSMDDMCLFNHIKEKLCLIVMSMPVFEVCTATMQNAIKFVLHDILQLGEGLLEQWLHQRQLYIVPM